MDIANIESRLKLDSGSRLVNLAASGHPDWAMLSGGFYWMVGDSDTGKTVLTVGFLAEASINPQFDGYDLIFDNAEDGAMMPIEQFYGKSLADRLQPPKLVDGAPVYSRTIEEFYFNLDDRIQAARLHDKKKKRKGKPFIYLLDSMDKLGTAYSREKFEQKKEAHEEGREAAGDYGDGKAKINSTYIRDVCADLQETNSILIILSQTRDNPAALKFQPKSVVAGGRSLKFYAQWQLWSRKAGDEFKTVHGTKRQVGIRVTVDFRKNRFSGKQWDVDLLIYWSHGLDDTGSCIDFLIQEKRIAKSDDGVLTSSDFEFKGKRAALIEKIESENMERQLRCVVTEVWKEIEEKCVVHRKSRYSRS